MNHDPECMISRVLRKIKKLSFILTLFFAVLYFSFGRKQIFLNIDAGCLVVGIIIILLESLAGKNSNSDEEDSEIN